MVITKNNIIFCKEEIAKYILWGATGQAKVLKEICDFAGLELLAVFDNNHNVKSPFKGVPLYYGKSEFLEWLSHVTKNGKIGFLVAIGGERGRDRVIIHQYLESIDLLIPFYVKHPTAYVASHAMIEVGSQIMAGAVIAEEAVIGKACIINTAASVDHESIVEDGVHIGPGARLAGNVNVRKYATVYTGAVVIPRIVIGEGAIVGAGAVVIKDVPPYAVVVGNPARTVKYRKDTEKCDVWKI